MAELVIALFGRYECTLHGRPIDDFVYDKVRALLAFLAVESDRPHRREYLAGLLWPDQPEDAARKSLRQALSKLRQAIRDHTAQPAHLIIQHDTIQFNRHSSYSLDVRQFLEIVEQAAGQRGSKHAPTPPSNANNPSGEAKLEALQRAIDLYQGDFLEGFYLRNTPEFENWWLGERARLREKYLECLRELAEQQAALENYSEAISLMRRFIELEPWQEEAQRNLMTWLTLAGQRTAALTQYDNLRQILDTELAIEPDEETHRLYERIRAGEIQGKQRLNFVDVKPRSTLPGFLKPETKTASSPRVAFVAREPHLARLFSLVEKAQRGYGQTAFISAEAGWGKTTLLENFSRLAQEKYPELIVAAGICTTYQGTGDPYLPFREILHMLAGDVEGKWAAGTISRAHALRLWALLPAVVHALVDQGRNLIDTFVPYHAVLERAFVHESITPELIQKLKAVTHHQQNSGINQERILEEYTEVLMEFSKQAPLLLIVDDMHWIDGASINLLYHLGRRLAKLPVMILGAYRSEDIYLGRDGKQHPLAPVLDEFKSRFGNIWLHLDRGGEHEARQFVDALLDTQPNLLGDDFREQLTRNTHGQPLFTSEMILEMQARGVLRLDEQGRWVNSAEAFWEILPERVEGIIENRVNRLDPRLREVLNCASVEGEEFTAEVVARVQGVDEDSMIRLLSVELAREHKLVRAGDVSQRGAQRISHYQFSHILFQKYIYSTLDNVERVHHHAAISNALQSLYEGETEEIAGRLAGHFQQAGLYRQAIEYLQQAGESAARVYAMADAISFYAQAIQLAKQIDLHGKPISELYIRLGRLQELDSAFDKALVTYEKLADLAMQQRDLAMEMASLIARLAILSVPTAVHDPGKARSLGERALILASELDDPAAEAKILWSLSIANFFLYHLQEAMVLGEKSLALARQQQLVEQTAQTLNDLGGFIYLYSGRLNQARVALHEASNLWRVLDNSPMLADSLSGSCITHVYSGDFEQAISFSQQAYQLSLSIKNLWGQSYSLWTIGDAYAERGEVSQAINSMEECIRLGKQAGFFAAQSYTPVKLAQIYLDLGLQEQAIQLAEEALEFSLAHMPAHSTLAKSVLARLYLRSGKMSEAIAKLQAANHDPYRDSWQVFFFSVPLAEAELAIIQGELSNALKILDGLVKRLTSYGMRLLLPEALYLQGKALCEIGRERSAYTRFLAARTQAEVIGSRRTAWRILHALHQLEEVPSQARLWQQEAQAVVEWILAHFDPQHAQLRDAFLNQDEVQAVISGH